jgi:hypothetical protein
MIQQIRPAAWVKTRALCAQLDSGVMVEHLELAAVVRSVVNKV